MDTVVILPFPQVQSMPWQDFLAMMVQTHQAAGFVCGDDFRFGRKGEGNADLLSRFCREQGLPFAMVPEQSLDGIRSAPHTSEGSWKLGRWKKPTVFWGIRISSAEP